MNSERLFIGRLTDSFPELKRLFEEHKGEFGEPLPHVFMGDVTRWALQPERDDASLSELSALLEKEYLSADTAVQELLVASFLENLLGEPGASRIEEHFGDALASKHREVRGLSEPNPPGVDWLR